MYATVCDLLTVLGECEVVPRNEMRLCEPCALL